MTCGLGAGPLGWTWPWDWPRNPIRATARVRNEWRLTGEPPGGRFAISLVSREPESSEASAVAHSLPSEASGRG